MTLALLKQLTERYLTRYRVGPSVGGLNQVNQHIAVSKIEYLLYQATADKGSIYPRRVVSSAV